MPHLGERRNPQFLSEQIDTFGWPKLFSFIDLNHLVLIDGNTLMNCDDVVEKTEFWVTERKYGVSQYVLWPFKCDPTDLSASNVMFQVAKSVRL